MLKSISCNYNDAYTLVSRTTTVGVLTADRGKNAIEVVFKNCAPLTDCMSKINNTQIDNAKNIDAVILIYDLIEYSDNYSKTSESLWQYYRDEPVLADAGILDNFSGNTASYKFKQKTTGSTGDHDTKAVQIMVPMKWIPNGQLT